MKTPSLSACYVSPTLSTEQFIPEHCFMYLISGAMLLYDGQQEHRIGPGTYGIGRRNHLARYRKVPTDGAFKKLFVLFDQAFLKDFAAKYGFTATGKKPGAALIQLPGNTLVESFIYSLTPYFNEQGTIEPVFLPLKRTELLLVLLQANPELAEVFFDFSDPEKINLEEFMQQNYTFNVSIERFAYLTGRSLSGFKRDFEKIFHVSPSHWLVQRRLEQAYYLIHQERKRPSDIYLELGFENFSHFSFAFKKLFGKSPSKLLEGGNAAE